MSNCHICESIKSNTGVIYSDETVIALLSATPSAVGHMLVTTRTHHPILEQVPDKDVSAVFQTANKLSIALFEGLGAQGTNILIQNGIASGQKHAHFVVNIIPRKEGDGLPLQWTPGEASPEQLNNALSKLQEALNRPVKHTKPQSSEPVANNTEESPKESPTETSTEEDYKISQLRRLP